MQRTWLDKAAGFFSPRWELERMRARVAGEMLLRHYEAASVGRRTRGWRRSAADANAAVSGGISALRNHARDLVRNNPHAESAVSTIADHTVGWGIIPKAIPQNRRAMAAWDEWANTTACDADGMHTFSGLQKLAWRSVVEAGEVLIRRRFRRPEDGLPIPMQIQLLEPDYLDTAKTNERLPGGNRIINGVEFDAIGRRTAYWLFPEHPGAEFYSTAPTSVRVPAENVLHVFRKTRPGQVRAVSWFAPVILRMKDFDEYEDAQLMKQKIAACLAVITTDVDGTRPTLGAPDDTDATLDRLSPGLIHNAPPGSDITIVQPPRVGEYGDYAEVTLRGIAAGLGLTYEDLTGDYTDLPFSAARMSRLRHWARVEDWRWQTLIPQMCDPVWVWAMEAAVIMGQSREIPKAQWTAPAPPMIEPDKEGLAAQRNIRTGITSLSEEIRARGFDPDELLQELADDYKKLDDLGLVLDSDGRKMTQQGQAQRGEIFGEAVEPMNGNGNPAAASESESDEDEETEDDDTEERMRQWLSGLPAKKAQEFLLIATRKHQRVNGGTASTR